MLALILVFIIILIALNMRENAVSTPSNARYYGLPGLTTCQWVAGQLAQCVPWKV